MNEPSKKHSGANQLFRGTSIVATLTLVSRVFGFVRDLLVARLFGASAIADCFFVAFRIPNLLRSFVAEGALTSAFVPIFTSELKKGKEQAQNVVSLISGFLILLTTSLTVLGIIFSPQVVSVIAPGFMLGSNGDLCVLLTRIMMPYIICISLVAMLGGALNSVQIFGVAAMSQVVMNLVLILGALIAAYFDAYYAVILLSVSVVAGGLAQVVIQIPAMARAGLKLRPAFNLRAPVIKELLLLMLPALMGATVYQISQFLNTLLASLLGSGSVSWLFYADRLTQLPIGIFSVALASVLLPTLSRANADGDKSVFARNLSDSLRYTSFCLIPLSAYIYYFAEPLIRLMFERGAFDGYSTIRTAQAVQAYAIGLWAVSCHSMLSRAFIAKKDTITPTAIGLVMLFTSICLALLFMGKIPPSTQLSPLTESIADIQGLLQGVWGGLTLGHSGLALASSLAACLAFVLSAFLLHVKHVAIDWLPFIRASWKALISTLIPLLLIAHFEEFLPSGQWTFLLTLLIACCGFIICSRILSTSEILELKKLATTKLNR